MDQSKHIPESAQVSNAPVLALTGDQMTEARRVRPQLPARAAEDDYRAVLEAISDIAPGAHAVSCPDPRRLLLEAMNLATMALGRKSVP